MKNFRLRYELTESSYAYYTECIGASLNLSSLIRSAYKFLASKWS